MTADAFICDYVRTPIGRYGGALANVRADDLAALPIRELMRRHPESYRQDRRGLSRMRQPGGRGQPQPCAHGASARGLTRVHSWRDRQSPVRLGDGSGRRGGARQSRRARSSLRSPAAPKSMTRAPFVTGKAQAPFQRSAEIFDTTIGWRFINPMMKKLYGVDSMPETAENVADEYQISRADQDAFALRSQKRAAAAQAKGDVRRGNRRGRDQGSQRGRDPRRDG